MELPESRAAPHGPPTPEELRQLEGRLAEDPRVASAVAWVYRDDPRFVEVEIQQTAAVRRCVTTTSEIVRNAARDGPEGLRRLVRRWLPDE